MCTKLRTVAASATQIYNGVILHAHPVRGESHNQRNTTATPTQYFNFDVSQFVKLL